MPRIQIAQIERAQSTIDPAFLHSPQVESAPLAAHCDARVLVKDETQNPIRSFKGRGADFFVGELQNPPARLVCASAGNFGQGLAYASVRRGIACDVFAALTANPLKIERMRTLGATVKLAGDDFDAAKDAGRAYAASIGAPFVEDGRDVAISEGAGTIGVELMAQPERPDTLVIPLGNGALLGGVATYVKHVAPSTRVIGVCAVGASSMEQSWRRKTKITTADARTIADGIAVRVPIQEALDDLRDVVDDIVLVSDDEILTAMHFMFREHEQMLEPAGAVGVAALMARRADFKGKHVATVLCGANVTPEQMRRWFA
ncbi:MAG: threonine/serine dehydratase [Gemmatimonadaceae bacterium]